MTQWTLTKTSNPCSSMSYQWVGGVNVLGRPWPICTIPLAGYAIQLLCTASASSTTPSDNHSCTNLRHTNIMVLSIRFDSICLMSWECPLWHATLACAQGMHCLEPTLMRTAWSGPVHHKCWVVEHIMHSQAFQQAEAWLSTACCWQMHDYVAI